MAQDSIQPPGQSRRRSRGRRWLRRLLALPLLLVLLSLLQVAALRFIDPPFSAFMAARQFQAWGEGDWGFRVAYDWRDRDQVSSHLAVAVIASEDQRFADHHGFDLEAIEKARRDNARGEKVRGASTISQQTAKNLVLWSGRSWVRKGIEAWYTLLIEALWPKQRIVEVYVNVAEFGDGVYGAQAAARTYFGKDASAGGGAAQPQALQRGKSGALCQAAHRGDPAADAADRRDWLPGTARLSPWRADRAGRQASATMRP